MPFTNCGFSNFCTRFLEVVFPPAQAEYGPYFLRNFQLAPGPGTPALLLFVSPLGGRDTQQQDETAPEPEVAVSLNSSQSFGLAKPPPPPKFAVGAAEESEVVVIDTLREPVAKAAHAAPEEELWSVDSDSDPEKSGPAPVAALAAAAAPAAAAYAEVQPKALVERTEVSQTSTKPIEPIEPSFLPALPQSSPSPPGKFQCLETAGL
eukprot:s640_g21.t1